MVEDVRGRYPSARCVDLKQHRPDLGIGFRFAELRHDLLNHARFVRQKLVLGNVGDHPRYRNDKDFFRVLPRKKNLLKGFGGVGEKRYFGRGTGRCREKQQKQHRLCEGPDQHCTALLEVGLHTLSFFVICAHLVKRVILGHAAVF